MKTKVMALALLAGSSMFAQSRFSIGIQLGGYSPDYNQGYYEPAPVYVNEAPPCPGPDYTWTDGYWSQNYGRRFWTAGYWRRPVYVNRFYQAERRENVYRRQEWNREREYHRDLRQDNRYNSFRDSRFRR